MSADAPKMMMMFSAHLGTRSDDMHELSWQSGGCFFAETAVYVVRHTGLGT